MQASLDKGGSKLFIGGLLVFALAGFILAWITTPWGVRVGYDSYFYLNAAENLLRGSGLSSLSGEGQIVPLTHFPPLYSLILAAVTLASRGDILLAARMTAVLIYGLNLFLFGFLALRFTNSWLAGFLSAGLFLLSPIVMDVIVSAFSEGLFLACLLLALFFLTEGVGELKARFLVAAGIASALACLTRYLGVTIILTGACAIFFLSRAPFKKKVFAAIGYLALSGLPLFLWYARNWIVAGSTSNRVFAIHWPKKGNFLIGIDTITGWFLPQAISIQIRQYLLLAGLIVLAVVIFYWARRMHKLGLPVRMNPPFQFVLINLLFCLLYCLALLVSRSFFDASTRWNSRILSPLYLAGFLAVIVTIWQAGQVDQFRWRKILASAVIVALYAFYMPQTVQFLSISYREGDGFSGAAWKNSETMQLVKQFSPGGTLYSNNPTAIYFVLGRQAISIPEQYDRVKKKYRPEFEQNLALMRQRLKQPESALVIFDPYQEVRENPPLDELTRGLVVYQDKSDGVIYVDPAQH
jgi:4-amino-4-deoxy-L-arabinose transferase-like glycosyltransferase